MTAKEKKQVKVIGWRDLPKARKGIFAEKVLATISGKCPR